MLQKEAIDTGLEAKKLSLQFLDEVLKPTQVHTVGVRLWDGTNWPDDSPRQAMLGLQHAGALRSMFAAGTELALAEAYLYNDFDIEGDSIAVFDLADALVKATNGWGVK